MQNFWPTVFFWTAFGIITWVVLRFLYFSKNVTLARRLRLVAACLEIAVLILLLFPWLPGAHGSSGWGLVLQSENIGMTVLVGLLFFTTVTLFTRKSVLVKAGVISHIVAIIVLFWLMVRLFPTTITLAIGDVAPIFAALIMLINAVVTLLLWHQLQKIAV